MEYKLVFADGSSQELLEPLILKTAEHLVDQIEDYSDLKEIHLPSGLSHSLMKLYQQTYSMRREPTPQLKQKLIIYFNDLLRLAHKLMDRYYIRRLRDFHRSFSSTKAMEEIEIDFSLPFQIFVEFYEDLYYNEIPSQLTCQEEFHSVWTSLSYREEKQNVKFNLTQLLGERFPSIEGKEILSHFMLHWLEGNQRFDVNRLTEKPRDAIYSQGQVVYLNYVNMEKGYESYSRSFQDLLKEELKLKNLFSLSSKPDPNGGCRKIRLSSSGIHFSDLKENLFLDLRCDDHSKPERQKFYLNQYLFVFFGCELNSLSTKSNILGKDINISVGFSLTGHINSITGSNRDSEDDWWFNYEPNVSFFGQVQIKGKNYEFEIHESDYLPGQGLKLTFDGTPIISFEENSSLNNFFCSCMKLSSFLDDVFGSKKKLCERIISKTVFRINGQKHIFKSQSIFDLGASFSDFKKIVEFFSEEMVENLLDKFLNLTHKRVCEIPDQPTSLIFYESDAVVYRSTKLKVIDRGYYSCLTWDQGYENRIKLKNLSIRLFYSSSSGNGVQAFFNDLIHPFSYQGKEATIHYDSDDYKLKLTFRVSDGFLKEFILNDKKNAELINGQINPIGILTENSLSHLIRGTVSHLDYQKASYEIPSLT